MGIIFIILSYFLGSIPTAYLVGKATKGIDIRQQGSGNVGSTNALRVIGVKGALIVGAVDFLKGFIPAYVGSHLFIQEIALVAMAAAVGGHIFPVWLKFRGGKGAATGIGAVIGYAPIFAIPIMGVWGVIFLLTGYVSLATILATVVAAILPIFAGESLFCILIYIGFCSVVLFKHRQNIHRLLKGEEHRFNIKKRSNRGLK